MQPTALDRHPARGRWWSHLYVQVLIAIALGVLVGHFAPATGEALKPLGDAFIKLVKMIIAPVIFLTVVTGIAGMTGSSTRSEVLGAIIGICNDGRVHMGIDNATCVRYVGQLIDLAKIAPAHMHVDGNELWRWRKMHCTGVLRKPWSLQPHGDIWRLASRTIRAKGPNSVRVT